MLRVLTLSTLFPDATRPTLGHFVERQTLELASRPDVDVRVVAPVGLPPGILAHSSRYRALARLPHHEHWRGLDVLRPKFLHFPRTQGYLDSPLMVHALTRTLRTLRRDFPFDVIDTEFFFPDGPAAATLGAIFNVPVSIKARGTDIHHWATIPTARRRIIGAGLAAQGMLAVSAALRDDMVRLGLPAGKIRVHYTGVDLARFRPRDRAELRRALGVEGPLVVCVGNLCAGKRQSLLIDALTQLPGYTLVLVGAGPDRARLAAHVRSAGVADRVRFTGALPHTEVADWMAAADVMALVSRSEGLANAWVEALACGTPVVLADVGGARELMDRPVAGHFVEPVPSQIAAAMRDLVDHPRDPSAVRACAERFTWQANTDQLLTHLTTLVEQSRASVHAVARGSHARESLRASKGFAAG